ncbi:MAG TPA: CAP domain-containing protein, partial [Anaerolineales bacterium]|nr:CAP domain-containing protein [Anaerolineales bacterium]
ENVYGSYPPLTGQGAVSWWINDKTDLRHNENLLSNIYTEIGVGYSFFGNFGYYVIVFAAPSVR